MSGIVIDANALNEVVSEIKTTASNRVGPYEQLLEDLATKCHIVTDRFIEQEWKNACGRQWVELLLVDWIQRGLVSQCDADNDKEVRDDLRVNYELPRKSSDHRYVACARQTEPHHVLTIDMDLYDPTLKESSRTAKRRARFDLRGKLCRHVFTRYGVTIECFCHTVARFGIRFTGNDHDYPAGCHAA